MQPSLDDIDDGLGVIDGSFGLVGRHLGQLVVSLAAALEERPEKAARSFVQAPLADEESTDRGHDATVLSTRLPDSQQRRLRRVERGVVSARDGLGTKAVVGQQPSGGELLASSGYAFVGWSAHPTRTPSAFAVRTSGRRESTHAAREIGVAEMVSPDASVWRQRTSSM